MFEFCGTDDLDEALRMWGEERAEMIALRAEAAQAARNESRLRAALAVVEKVFALLDGEMFLPRGVREGVEKVRGMKVFEPRGDLVTTRGTPRGADGEESGAK